MKTKIPPKGLIIDMITPLDKEGKLEKKGFLSLLQKIAPYADGLLLASPRAGEGMGLEITLKTEVLKNVMGEIQETLPLFFWISQDSPEKTKTALDHFENLVESQKYKGPLFWVDSPLYYHSNRGLYDYYKELVRHASHPIVLYNDPVLIKYLNKPFKRENIQTNIFRDLIQINPINAMIFHGSLIKANNYQKVLGSKTDFRIYDGEESRFLDHPSRSGLVSIGANLVPGTWSKLARYSIGMLKNENGLGRNPSLIWEKGKVLRELIRMYSSNPAGLIKGALVDIKVIGPSFIRCQEDKESLIARLISKHGLH